MVQIVDDLVYDKTKPTPKLKMLYNYPLRNVAGFSAIGLSVTFPPGAATPPHRHGGASVTGVVISGTTYNKMNNDPTMLLTAGDTWYEAPGCHHKYSANASDTEPLELLATFIIETKVVEEGGLGALVQVDEEYKDVQFH